ncbi:GPI inositol-deacylase [Abortiporus biennis]
MTRHIFVYLIGFFSVISVIVFYLAGSDIVDTLSPQGCRMSWMSPSYVLQTSFDQSWTLLAKRYSLWLYREVGWETSELRGTPVLFIPGNAGSSHQVRSIASSATRQYYSSPYDVSPEFWSRPLKPLDFFAVEFNEDLSAFHGTTLDSEKQYTSRAIDYILSLYPTNTTIIIMGHSMGGVVAMSLLPHPKISTIITMSTPHTLPPARFDRRIGRIYSANLASLNADFTPVLSLCGGSTDLMVPSESCILPLSPDNGPYRRTIFTSALEGCWTGVGHREMVWCHQVRWRIARAALELGAATTPSDRTVILDTWLRDGHTLPPGLPESKSVVMNLLQENIVRMHSGERLVLRNPTGSRTYVFSVPPASPAKFILYVYGGSIPPTSPRHPLPLRASVYGCSSLNDAQCTTLQPVVLKLIPSPIVGKPFPVPQEGSDESEGVVFFETEVEHQNANHIVVQIDHADGRGWVIGGFADAKPIVSEAGALAPFVSRLSIKIPEDSLVSDVKLTHLLSNALLVYRATPKYKSVCTDALLYPLLQHTSHPSETHYYPLRKPVLLHTHGSAPYLPTPFNRGINLTVYTSSECQLDTLEVTVDWWGTVGRWGVRYWSAVASWAVGIVAFVTFNAWRASETTGVLPPLSVSLSSFVTGWLSQSLMAVWVFSLLPLKPHVWLGNTGAFAFSFIAPMVLLIATGLVVVLWWILQVLMMPIRIFHKSGLRLQESSGINISRNTLVSMGLVLLLIFLLVPWQVAFLGCWIYHCYTCARNVPSGHPPSNTPMALTPVTPRNQVEEMDFSANDAGSCPSLIQRQNATYASQYLLLLMTWLLPLAAPVLAVWIRTLATAGYTTPFDGDHNVFFVVPFILMVEFGPWEIGFMKTSVTNTRFSSRWALLALFSIALVGGPRRTYLVFEAASFMLGVIVSVESGPRVWRRYQR